MLLGSLESDAIMKRSNPTGPIEKSHARAALLARDFQKIAIVHDSSASPVARYRGLR